MPNPDLQNYISQSRAAGLTDDQIRQNLLTQGWQANMVESALTGQASMSTKNNSRLLKVIILILLLLLVLPLLAWLIFAGFIFHKIKTNQIPINNTQSTNSVTTKQPFTCDNPNLSSLNFGYGQLAATLPTTWPTDIPQYPSSKFIGATNLTFDQNNTDFGYAVYCSKDTVQKISDYFVQTPSAYKLTVDDTANQTSTTGASEQILTGEGKTGHLMVSIGKQNQGDTAILVEYIGDNPKK